MLETAFWKRAAASLPAQVRSRYALELERAEQVDLAVAHAVDGYRRVTAGLSRWLDASVAMKPRSHP